MSLIALGLRGTAAEFLLLGFGQASQVIPPQPPLQVFGFTGGGGAVGRKVTARARVIEDEVLPAILKVKARTKPIVRLLGRVTAETRGEAAATIFEEAETVIKAHCVWLAPVCAKVLMKGESSEGLAAARGYTDDPVLRDFAELLEIL